MKVFSMKLNNSYANVYGLKGKSDVKYYLLWKNLTDNFQWMYPIFEVWENMSSTLGRDMRPRDGKTWSPGIGPQTQKDTISTCWAADTRKGRISCLGAEDTQKETISRYWAGRYSTVPCGLYYYSWPVLVSLRPDATALLLAVCIVTVGCFCVPAAGR